MVILLTCSPGEPGERRSPAHLVSGRSPLTMLLVIPSARANCRGNNNGVVKLMNLLKLLLLEGGSPGQKVAG
jgi:hypothetical protein